MKVPKWRHDFAWAKADCVQMKHPGPYSQGGPLKYWLTLKAAQQVYEKLGEVGAASDQGSLVGWFVTSSRLRVVKSNERRFSD